MKESDDNSKIEIGYVTFTFNYNWIKNKTIVHQGTDQFGMVWILDETGKAVKGYGYEMISTTN